MGNPPRYVLQQQTRHRPLIGVRCYTLSTKSLIPSASDERPLLLLVRQQTHLHLVELDLRGHLHTGRAAQFGHRRVHGCRGTWYRKRLALLLTSLLASCPSLLCEKAAKATQWGLNGPLCGPQRVCWLRLTESNPPHSGPRYRRLSHHPPRSTRIPPPACSCSSYPTPLNVEPLPSCSLFHPLHV
jgi:hypothetical protein